MFSMNEEKIKLAEKNLADRSTEVKKVIFDFEKRASGYSWDNDNNTYVKKPNNLCVGSDVIRKSTALLNSVASDISLISKPREKELNKLRYNTEITFIRLFFDMSFPKDEISTLFRQFRNTLNVLISGIRDSRAFLEKAIGIKDEEQEDKNIGGF